MSRYVISLAQNALEFLLGASSLNVLKCSTNHTSHTSLFGNRDQKTEATLPPKGPRQVQLCHCCGQQAELSFA
jgi:hypothetical protein